MSCGVGCRQGSDPCVAVALAQAGGYSSNLTPSLGTSICRQSSPRNGKKKKKKVCFVGEIIHQISQSDIPQILPLLILMQKIYRQYFGTHRYMNAAINQAHSVTKSSQCYLIISIYPLLHHSLWPQVRLSSFLIQIIKIAIITSQCYYYDLVKLSSLHSLYFNIPVAPY